MGPGGGGLHVKDLTRGKWFALAGHKNSHALPVGPPGDPVQPPGRTLGLADDAKSIMCIRRTRNFVGCLAAASGPTNLTRRPDLESSRGRRALVPSVSRGRCSGFTSGSLALVPSGQSRAPT
jgi:hypothetical protein